MDGLSAAATIIPVAQVAWQAYGLCQEYYSEVKDARKDIQNLNQEVTSLAVVLTSVSDLAQDEDAASFSNVSLLTKKGGPVDQCRDLLDDLIKKLDTGEGDSKMRKFGMRALKWPFRNKDIDKLITTVGKHKATFNMALAADTAGLVRAIEGRVAKLGDNIAEMQVGQKGFINDTHWKKIYLWLSPPDPSSNHNTACSRHQPTTGAWFLNSEEFMTWKTGSNSVIWLYGIPGCGKTILTSTIIEDVLKDRASDPGAAVVYFYFDFHDNEKRKVENLVRSLIVQLSTQSAKTPESLEALFSSSLDGSKQPKVEDLIQTFQQILENFQNVFIIVDALDECGDRDGLLMLLENIFNWQLEKLHILATSRRERDIEDSFESFVTAQVSIQSERVNPDIQIYISERLKKDLRLRKWPMNVKTEIEETLMARADGMFRWVVCQLDSLKKYLKQDILRKALKSLPRDLNETYDQILNGIDEDYIEDAFKILQWLVHSTRPLDLAEVAEVVAVGLGNDPHFDPLSRLREPRDVLAICSSLITTVSRIRGSEYDGHAYQQGEVRLAHFSVKEYLLTARVRKGDTEYAIEKDDQGNIAKTCLTYLLHFQEPAMLTPSYTIDFPLAEYAANYWFTHAKAARKDIDQINKLGLRLCGSNGAYVNWIRLRDLDGYEFGDHDLSNRDIDRFDSRKKFAPPLYYAALAGLVDLSRALLESGAKVNARGGRYGYALQAACDAAYPLVVKLLLENGADINAKGGDHGTALHAACYRGNVDIVKLLLEQGASVHVEDKYKNTALQLAHNENQEAIIQVILEMRVDIKRDYLAHRLLDAALEGQSSVVKKLLEQGADIDYQSGRYNSALQAASYNGHEAVVKLLLEKGANVNIKGGEEFDTPLQAASVTGKEAIVKILLENGADVNAQGGESGSPLQAAASEGHEAVVRLLLENGADINVCIRGGLYPTALAAAAFAGHEAIVRLLLEKGIDTSYCAGAIMSVGDGALVMAFGHYESASWRVVKLLHENGAEFTPEAFQTMCREGALAVVKLMLEIGLDFTPDVDYYKKVLEETYASEKFATITRGEKEVSKRGHKAVRGILREKIAEMSGQIVPI